MASEPIQAGTLLNERYRILHVLGRGGMGTVYQAEHIRLDAVVAVKEIVRESGNEDQDRFDLDGCEQEARLLVRLNHPNLPKVTDAFIEQDRFYLVMEYIEGVTLEKVLRDSDGPLDVGRVIEWSIQVTDVLDYLHSLEPAVIFRDVKPANLMLQPNGEIRLIDFGIARRFHPGANKDTSLLGSVGYSPPEQFGRQQTDVRSDLYALGATLHHLLTGRDPAAQPFKFPPARSLNPQVPESLSSLIASCLALDPADRPGSALEVRRSLLAAREEPSLVKPVAPDAAPAPHPIGSKSVAGSGSGRRIVSTRPLPAERKPRHAAASSRPGARLVAGVVALIVVSSGTYALLRAQSQRPHSTKRPAPVLVSPAMNDTTQPSQPSAPAPRDSSQDTTSLPPTDVPTITVTVEKEMEEQGVFLLPVTLHGTLKGHAGSTATLAVFVYDANGNPLQAVDHESTYANPDGQLSIATRISVTSDEQPFKVSLNLPLRQFPSQEIEGAADKVRGLLAVDGQSFYSDLVDLPLPAPTATPDSSGATGGSTGSTPESSGNP